MLSRMCESSQSNKTIKQTVLNMKNISPDDGQLAYLCPGSERWQALDEGTFISISHPEEISSYKLNEEDYRKLHLSKETLSEILLKSLQLPNLSLFAGSGTSLAEVGGPSMWNLWQRSMLIDPNATKDDFTFNLLKPDAETTIKAVKYTETANPNIEHFLSQCDSYLSFNEDSDIEKFINSVKEIIVNECSSFIDREGSDLSAYELLLQKLARRRVRDPRLKIFTTNYDMCFETAASNLGLMVVDGFSYTRIREFNGRYFNYDVVRRDVDSNEYVEGIFQLYKLHGSVSWERKDKNIIESNGHLPQNAVLIYPAKGKYQQAFIQPHLELLSRFLEALRQPNSCLLIAGFGFNDDHLSEPIISAVRSNPGLKLIISDFRVASNIGNSGVITSPYWKELSELSLRGYDIHFINGSFSKFASLIPNLRALSPADHLVKAVKIAGKQI